MITRRTAALAAAGILVAPAVVRAQSLMRIPGVLIPPAECVDLGLLIGFGCTTNTASCCPQNLLPSVNLPARKTGSPRPPISAADERRELNGRFLAHCSHRSPRLFDDPAWLFDLKLDGFRGIADTVEGRMLSKNGHRLKRFERLLDALPPGCVFNCEIVALDDTGRPVFNDLMFGRRAPRYVAFDVLIADGQDVRAMPLKDRRAMLAKVVRRYSMQQTEPVIGEGKAAFKVAVDLDLEGIVAKRLADPYGPRTKWWKVLNPSYSQKGGRGELFQRRATGAATRAASTKGSSPRIAWT